jgi:hypothetical protein
LAHFSSNHTDHFSNDGMYILFTESHENLSNSIYGMYEIRMSEVIQRIFYSLVKFEFVSDTNGNEVRKYFGKQNSVD